MENIDAISARRKALEQHSDAVLDPIREDVTRALQAFARARQIDILLDRAHIDSDAILYIAPTADITSAFIKHYNASHSAKAPALSSAPGAVNDAR